MASTLPGPEWIIAAPSTESEFQCKELLETAKTVWPRALAYAQRQNTQIPLHERESLATEVWERLLISVSNTLRRPNHAETIQNLEAYLFGAFQHRFHRALRKERYRREIVQLLPHDSLTSLMGHWAWQWKHWFERHLQVEQIVAQMDNWTREVWASRQYGYSWREIANRYGMNEAQAKMRYRNALARIRQRLLSTHRPRNSGTKQGGAA